MEWRRMDGAEAVRRVREVVVVVWVERAVSAWRL